MWETLFIYFFFFYFQCWIDQNDWQLSVLVHGSELPYPSFWSYLVFEWTWKNPNSQTPVSCYRDIIVSCRWFLYLLCLVCHKEHAASSVFFTAQTTAVLKAERNWITWGLLRPCLEQMSTYMLGKPALCNRSTLYLIKSAFHCFLLFKLPEFNFSTESSNPASALLSEEGRCSCCTLSKDDRNHRRPERCVTFSESNISLSISLLRLCFLFLFAPVKWMGPQRHVQVQRGEVRSLVHVRQQLVHVHVRWVAACKSRRRAPPKWNSSWPEATLHS